MKEGQIRTQGSQAGRGVGVRLLDSFFGILNSLRSPAQNLHTVLMRWGIYACFFLSGATALVFEVLWSRQFVTVFGNSSYAISIVLCAYMAGLGLGGLFGGRLADRVSNRLALYGIIQAVVGGWAIAMGPMLYWLRAVVSTLPALSPESLLISTLARFGLSFAILIVPCFLMGATLPLLVRAVTESQSSIGSRIGVLYCLNTLGAALGCFASGFWMLETLGVRVTNLVAVGVNFAIGIAAFALSRPMSRGAGATVEFEMPLQKDKTEEPAVGGGLLLTIGFLNGLAGLACEVLWIRYMAFIDSSTYVFPTILCIYLLGIGLGGLVYGLLARRIRRPARTLGLVEVVLGLSVLVMFIGGALIFAAGPPPPLKLKGMTFVTVFIPTVLMGISFPLLCAVYGRQVQTLGRRIGLLLAVNTAGTVAGSLLPIFVLVRLTGIQNSIMLMCVLYGVMGLALLASNRPLVIRTAVVYTAALLLFFAIVPSNLCQRVFLATSFALGKHTDIVFYREGRTGTSIITRDRVSDRKIVYINSVCEVPLLYISELCFKMIGDLGPMLQANPDDVLMICFGGGVASGAMIQLPEVKNLTIVDLEKSIVKAAETLSKENNNLLQNPKTHVVIDDGRNYIRTSSRKWPVIVSDSTHPRSGDSWVLYTQEFYRLVSRHLTDDGVFVEWVPTHGLCTEEFKIIVRTFQSVFPHASMWITQGMDEQGRFSCFTLLAATPGPLKIDVARLRERLNAEAVRRDLEPFGLHTPAGFLDTFLCAEDTLREWAGKGPVNTDDLPYTQYLTRYSKGLALTNTDLAESMEDIWPYLTQTGGEPEAKQLRDELKLRARASRLLLMGRLQKAFTMLPEDVRYRQMRRLYEGGPLYIQNLMGIYRDDPEALNFLAGFMEQWPGGTEAVESIYKRVLKFNPKNVSVLNKLGAVCTDANYLQAAEDYLRRAVRFAPASADAHYNLGLLLEKLGRHTEALQHLQKAAISLKDPRAAYVLGLLLMRNGHDAEAVKWFSRAVELSPILVPARIQLAVALHRTGNTQEALPHLRYVLKINPEDETALNILAEIDWQDEFYSQY